MSKVQNKNNQSVKKDNSKIIFITIILIAIIAVLYFTLFDKEDKPVIRTNNQQQQQQQQQSQNPLDNGPMTDTVFQKEGEIKFIKTGTNKILYKVDAEVSDDNIERAQGLMFRSTMKDTEGMIFLFPNEEIQSFWMRNTKIPLDIIYVDKNFNIVKIYQNTTPFSTVSLPSVKPAKYVVEINAGLSEKYKISAGDKIEFNQLK
ncbi:MAG TPA: DUF192 domain-containing protein [Ignavibacteria bacterium]|nr:DUF192 domain-containing protein [Ignavibacteria bacterium]